MREYETSAIADRPHPAFRNGSVARLSGAPARISVRGKFLFQGSSKFYVRGVTYGTFATDGQGKEQWSAQVVERDFEAMAAHGFNAVRIYTPPPRWLLDLAVENGLYVMVGLPWEQHITFLGERGRVRAIERRLREALSGIADHPAVLCYAIGNEIPAPITRWHGSGAIERTLERYYRVVKEQAPDALVTYVNFPSTEYLSLPFLDLACFNVYLESKKTLEAYLARLQNLAGERPLLMAEIGLDSRRNGQEKQASVLDWQIRTTMAAGAAGAFIFAWTDEWFRGGHPILDWDFGLTTRDRQPKLALSTVSEVFADIPFPAHSSWPHVSVVVCTYNGSRTLAECLHGLSGLEYPSFEVIVVDDGSTDHSSAIARRFNCRLITTENRGLSSARNTGLKAATGSIIAFIDDDAYPDPHWLHWLVSAIKEGDFAGAGGPNIAPPGDGAIAECVKNSPGGPNHVLTSDRTAEHIPGCNMAFKTDCLRAVGGFDPQFRAAGDDVDLCWRLQECGWKIGFSPAAMVWHHRRNSVRAYLKQQRGYGKAEALLERKWPEKYNSIGHIKWRGRIYGSGLIRILGNPGRIYHGLWGSAPFQPVHCRAPGFLSVLPTMPEWYLILGALSGLCALSVFWAKLVVALPLLLSGLTVSLAQAMLSARHGSFPSACRSQSKGFFLICLTTLLHLLQPAARLWGRLQHGLTAWRPLAPRRWAGVPFPVEHSFWNEAWKAPEEILSALEGQLRQNASVVRGGPYDRWDLEARGGLLGAARVLTTVEEHGSGKQLFRFRTWPRFSMEAGVGAILLIVLAALAALDSAWIVVGVFGTGALMIFWGSLQASSSASVAIEEALKAVFGKE